MVIIDAIITRACSKIAGIDTESEEGGKRRLEHSSSEAEGFYRERKQRGVPVRVAIEASAHTRRFERLLVEFEIEL